MRVPFLALRCVLGASFHRVAVVAIAHRVPGAVLAVFSFRLVLSRIRCMFSFSRSWLTVNQPDGFQPPVISGWTACLRSLSFLRKRYGFVAVSTAHSYRRFCISYARLNSLHERHFGNMLLRHFVASMLYRRTLSIKSLFIPFGSLPLCFFHAIPRCYLTAVCSRSNLFVQTGPASGFVQYPGFRMVHSSSLSGNGPA